MGAGIFRKTGRGGSTAESMAPTARWRDTNSKCVSMSPTGPSKASRPCHPQILFSKEKQPLESSPLEKEAR